MQSERRKNKGDESVCRVLNEEEMCRIYHEYLPRDFAADEIKPLVLMLDMLHNGTYEPLGLYLEGQLCGYAFFIRKEDWLLLDYYVILPEWRNQGIGGIFLKKFKEFFRDCAGILLEVERPEMAENEQERTIRVHRIRFYQRNGVQLTGLKVPSIVSRTQKANLRVFFFYRSAAPLGGIPKGNSWHISPSIPLSGQQPLPAHLSDVCVRRYPDRSRDLYRQGQLYHFFPQCP